MNVKQYDGSELISGVAIELKSMPEFNAPEWTMFVKTGVSKVRPPIEADWWQTRVAAILRKVAILGPVGVNKLRRQYGGKYRRGYRPNKFQKASGKIIRVALQQLEKAGMVKQATVDGHKGRVVGEAGIKLLAKVAKNLRVEAAKKTPVNEAPKSEKPAKEAKVEETPIKEEKVEGKSAKEAPKKEVKEEPKAPEEAPKVEEKPKEETKEEKDGN